MDDEYYMKEALKEAKISLREGNWPIGCVIVMGDKIIARAHNQVYTTNNRMAHAEMLALRSVHKELYENKYEATLYTTYEPCPMCFGASILNRIKRVVSGIDLDNSGAMYFRENLPLLFKQKDFEVQFTRGVLSKECYNVFIQGQPTKKLIKSGRLREGHDIRDLDI